MEPRGRARLLWLIALALFSAPSLRACSVPVFRYALEKWPPDRYAATIFHRGPLSPGHAALVRSFAVDHARANVTLQSVDLAGSASPEQLAHGLAVGTNALPWLVVDYPAGARLPGHVHSGPFTASALPTVVTSPARAELARRLLRGDSAVWLLLESGDRARDDASAKLVETRLAYLTSVLKLPALDPQDIASGLVTVPAGGLKLAFTLMRVARSDPAEATLVSNLLGSEADLAGSTEPMLFPVFGRGRALYALVGAGINPETIDEAATFLIGRCSCQVKELNPGVDLLLTADWDSVAQTARRTETRPATAAPDTVTIRAAAETSPPSPVRPASPGNGLLFGGGLIAALLAAALWWRKS